MKILLSLLMCLPVLVHAVCVEEHELRSRSVVVEKYGRGVGTGTLLNGRYILTAYHVVEGIEHPNIWVKLMYKPTTQTGLLPLATRLVKFDKVDDLALLELEEPLDIIKPISLLHEKDITPNMPLVLAGFAHGQAAEFAVVSGQFKAPARRSENGPVNSIYAILDNRTYGGDSGGGLYTCHGALMGVQIGSQAHLGKPAHIAAVAPGNIQLFLSGIFK